MLKKTNLQRGFTLIELLVVIAIIGLLSAVVLASLNSARAKGADAAIKSDLRGILSQAALIYDTASPNSYATVCTDTTVVAAMTHAASASGFTYALALQGTAGDATHVACHQNGTNFLISVPLKSNSANAWCVDDSGNSKQITTTGVTINLVACP